MRYVALGDSYTIGTSISSAESWPSQLAARVPQLEVVANLGVNGYSSRNLIEDELPALPGLQPEFATLLIGVNDVVQGVADTTYRANVDRILDTLLGLLPADRFLCLATPDYTVTSLGAAFGPPEVARAGIERVNSWLAEASAERGIAFLADIFPISRAAEHDRSLVADDGLHPSAAQYARWVDLIQPVVEGMLDR